jgi:phospholipase C
VAGRRAVEHVVVIVKENRTHDTYFAPRGAAGPCRALCTALCMPSRRGALGGSTRGPCRCTYPPEAVAYYRALASAFATADRYFTEVRGPSDPNHLMLMAADSPTVDNLAPGQDPPDMETIADRFEAAGLTWRNYAGRPAGGLAMFPRLRRSPANRPLAALFSDAAAGDLPHLAWVIPPFSRSEHPPAPPSWGQDWTATVVAALMSSPCWPRLVAFVVWDDWGGFWDSVSPPVVERWRDGTPFRYGRRSPFLALGGPVRRGYRRGGTASHVSLLRFCEATFGLPPLTFRDAEADPLLDVVDPDAASLPAPPLPRPPRSPWAPVFGPILDWMARVWDV